MRASPAVLVMVPNVWLWMLRSGGPKFGWFSRLNASTRNMKYWRATVVMRLDSACPVTVHYQPRGGSEKTATAPSSGSPAVTLTGLTPATPYTYSVEACGARVGGEASFETAPLASSRKAHFAVVGDSGTGSGLVARTAVELCVLWGVHCRFDPDPVAWPLPYDDAAVATTLAAMITRSMNPPGGA